MTNGFSKASTVQVSATQKNITGAVLVVIGFVAVCSSVLSGAQWFNLAQWGIEVPITIASVGEVESRVLDERDQSRRYAEEYGVTYDVDSATKSYTWTHYSMDSQSDYAVGQQLPAVIDDLESPTDLYAPTTKKELWLGNVLGKGMIGLLGILLSAAGVAMLVRKTPEVKVPARKK